jgi:protein-tyrosine phosphatase
MMRERYQSIVSGMSGRSVAYWDHMTGSGADGNLIDHRYARAMTAIQSDPHTARVLSLEGAHNIRDLGGLETRQNSRTVSGRFLRADSLHDLSVGAQMMLLESGLRTVIDLRSPKEFERQPNPFANHEEIKYVNVSLFGSLFETKDANAMMPSLEGIYVSALEMCQPAIRTVLETMAGSESLTLFHCTAGKDRTGIIAALLLANAEVPDETIADDYALTEQLARQMLERLLDEGVEDGMERESFAKLLTAQASTMHATLGYLEGRFGGVNNYLKTGLGLEEKTVEELRSKLLEFHA